MKMPKLKLDNHFQENHKKQIEWLLEGDPSIRYQTLRDLVNVPVKDIYRERQRVLKEGWGRRFDIIRCLDHFQERNIKKDNRMTDAVDLLIKKQTTEGFWKREMKYPGKIFFEMEKAGKESRWNTLRALRILKWWGN